MDRRSFIKTMTGATIAAIAAGCRRPEQKIIPMVMPVEYRTPGVADYFSTVFTLKNAAFGVVVKSYEGRPVKIDGNEQHPTTKGVSSAFMQASLFDLYNPARMRMPKSNDSFVNLDEALNAALGKIKTTLDSGKNVYFILDEHCSPTLAELANRLSNQNEKIKFVTIPSLYPECNAARANKIVTGIDAEFVPDLSKADFVGHVISLDNDFLGTEIYSPLYTNRIRFAPVIDEMIIETRILVAESYSSITGKKSFKHALIHPEQVESVLVTILANTYNVKSKAMPLYINNLINKIGFSKELIQKFNPNNLYGCVVVGKNKSVISRILASLINIENDSLDYDKFINPFYQLPFSNDKTLEIKEFIDNLKSNNAGLVISLDNNIMYHGSPEIVDLLIALPKENKINLSLYNNETEREAALSIPATHCLESWGDALFYDGTTSIRQPVIAPLNINSISIEDFLLKTAQTIAPEQFSSYNSFYDLLFEKWNQKLNDSGKDWESLLKDGFLPAEERKPVKYEINYDLIEKTIREYLPKPKNEGLSLVISPSLNVYDGTYSNNYWMQEMPNQVTGTCWGNPALISPKTATDLSLRDGDVISIKKDSREVKLPVKIDESVLPDIIAAFTGYGRFAGDPSIDEKNGNVFRLRNPISTDSLSNDGLFIENIIISKTGERQEITFGTAEQAKFKDLIINDKDNTNYLIEFKNRRDNSSPIQAREKYKYKSNRWGMVIDLSKCTGCSACVLACQAENNIPFVGKKESLRNRQMQWINILQVNEKNESNEKNEVREKKHFFLPLMCQHCGNAPCEPVCPVFAASHSPEGVAETTYNRCIGSRFCMMNCPFKIRRFNFYNYNENLKQPYSHIFNPEVTVRSRGVVEKCSFCIHRLNQARYKAKDMGLEKVPDGMVKTACQQACPSGAIMFGDLNDENSEINKYINDEHLLGVQLFRKLELDNSIIYVTEWSLPVL